MNKRQSRHFAIGSTVIAALAFIGLTIDSHRQFPKLTNAQNITPAVTNGKDVWHRNNCINCHTLFGEGAYYAPDLTKIAQHRSVPYLEAFLRDPSQFYDEQRHRRLMPKQDLTDTEISDLVTFLDWVSKVDNQGWPPRPILVTGAGTGSMGAAVADAPTAAASASMPGGADATVGRNPVALGERVFKSATPACAACHSLLPGADMAGPTLAGVVARAEKTLASGEYTGKATDVDGYLRESITHPSAHIVAGGMYSANKVSFMPTTYADELTPEQLSDLAAFLATFK
jgi:nitric oxide reductase subunit C